MSLLIAALSISTFLTLGEEAAADLAAADGMVRILLIVGVCAVCLHYADLYELRTINGTRDLLVRLLQALGAAAIVLAVIYFWFPDLVIGRGVFLLAAAPIAILVVSWRLAFYWVARHVGPRERLLLVGTNAASVSLARELYEQRAELGVDIVGFVDPDPGMIGAPVLNPGVVGTIEDIPALVSSLNVDRVVVSLADARGRLPMARLLDVRLQSGVAFEHLASIYEEYTGKIAVENLRPSWFIFSTGFRKTRVLLAAKRAVDVTLSIVGLILAAPLMALIAGAIALSSRGPVLYRQTRVGAGGTTFDVIKFRTMRVDAEQASGPVWSRPNDTRVIPIGRLLRRMRLDEIPQLWNVLKGQMSFVGPRPERPAFVEQLTASIPFYSQRHVVKPGLTGWAQVRYTYGASVEDAIEKLQYDLYYVKHLSIALDVVIVLETIKTVLLRRGAR
jgi:sugar transferase (PEP-CTERM system associated)